MPGSKCNMPSALNGLHIRHEFRGKTEIACSCAGPSWLCRGRSTCWHSLKGSLPLWGSRVGEGDRGGHTLPKGETSSAHSCVCTHVLVGRSEVNLKCSLGVVCVAFEDSASEWPELPPYAGLTGQ